AAPPSFRIELVEIALQTTAIPRRQFRGASLRIGERSRDFRSVARQRAPESRWNEALFFQTPQERGDGVGDFHRDRARGFGEEQRAGQKEPRGDGRRGT